MENEYEYLKVGKLKEMLKDIPDNTEVFIRCCINPCGNIVEAGIADKSEYSFFGKPISCIIIEPANNSFSTKKVITCQK
jgi:hypothetical protein